MGLYLTSACLAIFSIVMLIFPPEYKSYGYKTPNSLRDKESWNLAQDYSAKAMLLVSGFLILSNILLNAFLIIKNNYRLVIDVFLIIISFSIMFYWIEKKLKRSFLDK